MAVRLAQAGRMPCAVSRGDLDRSKWLKVWLFRYGLQEANIFEGANEIMQTKHRSADWHDHLQDEQRCDIPPPASQTVRGTSAGGADLCEPRTLQGGGGAAFGFDRSVSFCWNVARKDIYDDVITLESFPSVSFPWDNL